MPRVKLNLTAKTVLWSLQFYLVILLILILVRFLRVL